jgi:putative transposase
MGRIHRLYHFAEQLTSDIAKTSKAKRSRKRQAFWKLNARIRNLEAGVHWKLESFLSSNFNLILLSVFKTSRLCMRGKRRLRSKSVRQMLTWSHCTFQQRLLSKAEEYGVRVVICDEGYKSKTCERCGMINNKLRGNKKLKCPHSALA